MKKPESEVKISRKSVRLTEDMNKLISMVAKEQGVSVAKYLRDAALVLAELSTEEKELVDLIKDQDKIKAMKTFHLLIQESKDTVLNSVQNTYADLSGKIDTLTTLFDRLEKLVKAFLYVYLFHTPEIKKHLKDSAKKSAQEREKKILSYVKQKSSLK